MTEFQQEVINLVNDNFTISLIAKKLNRNMSSVSSVVKRFKLTPKKAFVNTVQHDFFDNIDTELKAYMLGFFIADGCINKLSVHSNGRFGFVLSIDDIDIIKSFKNALKIPSNIQFVNNQNGVKHRKIQCRLRWTSPYMRDVFVEKYKIIPRKTMNFTFKFPIEHIPTELRGHFVRGFIDGDGYMGNNGNPNNFSVSIVGTSIEFLLQIGDLVSENTGMIYNVYTFEGKTCKYYILRWSCEGVCKFEKITKLKNYLYDNATMFLNRKKEKIDAYIKYRANALNNINAQCNALEMKLKIEYNSPTSAQPLTSKVEGENIC